jgi:NADH:ubiquinone oxidoreductase subunit 3 (subunit A)
MTHDFLFACTLYIQPPIIGLALVSLLRRGLVLSSAWVNLLKLRQHRKGFRFFECAVRPRLQQNFRYELPLLTFCGLFVLYDADLFFFLPEVIVGEAWTSAQLLVVGVCVGGFLGGLWYDMTRCGFV